MQKKAVKNFVYSFLFSLLAVAAVGKVIFRTPETPEKQPENKAVKAQSISLFSKPQDLTTNSESPAPQIDISAIEALTAEEVPAPEITLTPDEVKVADTAITEHKTPPAAKVSVGALPEINTDILASQEIVLSPKDIASAQTVEPDYEQSGIVYADISDTLQDEQKQNIAESEPAKVLYAPEEADTSIKTDNIVVADNAALSVTPIEDDNIPLLETSGVLHKQINVDNSAGNSEIAMLEPNTLVNTIEEADAPEDKTLAEADLKQNEWQQMSEIKSEDSPWVVARGNRFAKNKNVVEQFAEQTVAANEPAPVAEPENNETVAAEAPAVEESPVSEEPATEEPSTDDEAGNTASLRAAAESEAESVTLALNPETTNKAGAETKVAYQMVPNLLIPIPDDIANDPDLTPQLSYSPNDKPAKKEVKPDENKPEGSEENLNEEQKKTGLFKSITSWFAGNKKNKDENAQTETTQASEQGKSTFDFFGVGNKFPGQSKPTKILPAELRLSFQPNRAEISGQTLRWIHAFADNARDNDDLYIEVRIDGTSSFALQKKRLNLLSTILANRGVDYRKINIVFTSREPNSFIIRNIRFNNNEEVVVNKDNDNSYYRPW